MEKIKEMVISFFHGQKANVEEFKEYILVENASEEFEMAYGKKSPYKVYLDRFEKGFESLDKNSKFIECIMKFLEKNTSTTILKINLKVDPVEKIKEKILLKNCFLKKISKNYENNFFSRFTFKTIFRYLNKFEEEMNEIFIYENKIIEGDLKDYEISEGELDKIDGGFMKEDYKIAREKIGELIQPRIDKISEEISTKLNKETERILEHYQTQRKEFLDKMEKLKSRSKNESFENIFQPENYEVQLKESLTKIKKEEEFSIADLKQKLSVAIETKIINRTAIYYPIYRINLSLEDGQLKKDFEIKYDPLKDELEELECPSCNKELKEISLCNSGHLSCSDCLFRCTNCGKQFCKNCLKNKCNSCGGPICDECLRTCKKCKNSFCKQHIDKIQNSKDCYCSNCLESCSKCHKNFSGDELILTSNGRKICLKCLSKLRKEKVISSVFS